MKSASEPTQRMHVPGCMSIDQPDGNGGWWSDCDCKAKFDAAGVKTSAKMTSVTVTPVTNFRIPTDIKEAAQVKAEAEGKTLSRVVIDLLREYAREEK